MQSYAEPATVATPERSAFLGATSGVSHSATAVNRYRHEHLMNLSPVQVVHKLYDVAIQACKKQDYSLAQRAITELIVALNFDYAEISTGLYRLYDFCKRRIREGKPDEAVEILEELRTAWVQAFKLV